MTIKGFRRFAKIYYEERGRENSDNKPPKIKILKFERMICDGRKESCK